MNEERIFRYGVIVLLLVIVALIVFYLPATMDPLPR